MAYATRTQLAQLGLRDAAIGDVSTDAQEEALEAASEVIDGYLRSRFTLPLSSYGKDVVRAACVIAAYDLLVVRGYNPEAGASDPIRQRYDDVMDWLRDVASGQITPTVVDSSSSGAARSAPRAVSNSSRGW